MKTYSYRLLRPFKFSKNKLYSIWLFLLISSFGIPIILGLLFPIPFLALTLWIGLLIFTNIFGVTVLLKTEYNGEISINSHTVKFAERQIEFHDIALLTLKPHISSSRSSYIPRWKQCDELEIKLKDNSEYLFLISENYPPLTMPIFNFLEKIKQTNKEYNEKIKLPNRTGFFLTEDKKHST